MHVHASVCVHAHALCHIEEERSKWLGGGGGLRDQNSVKLELENFILQGL